MIETTRLILRPFEEGDEEDLFAYLKLPQVPCFSGMQLQELTQAQAQVRQMSQDREYTFAIVEKASGRVIGQIDAHPESVAPGGAPQDTFSPCWMLHPAWQGKGYAFEAAQAFFDYLFREKGARRIYAYVEADNDPSRRLAERLGMRHEGTFVEFVSFVKNPDGSDKYETTCQYAILRREWERQ